MSNPWWLALVSSCVAGSALAETAYVTDVLRLGIHAAADTSDRAFDNLVSGTPVDVLERSGNFARVRLVDGREGFVRATFLVADKPAAARIAELETALAAAEGQATTAKAAQTGAEQELARIASEANSVTALQGTVEQLQQENQALAERLDAYRLALPLGWVVAALALLFVAGFAAGLWWLDARIRRRHGGFRVY